ncbi:MAG: tetratricopeptide repeat protein [Bdellovibrionales bacterium]|nr:tetratricopeptide repeat protein [Bdellovibrionales bacterium]
MGTQVFTLYISVLFSGLIWAYGAFSTYFNDSKILQAKIHILREAVNRENLRTRLAEEQMAAFKQQVALVVPSLIPKKGKGEKGYGLRQLASVTNPKDGDSLREHISSVLFERAKNKFREENYEGARELFKKIINDFSYSLYVVDSYFLLSETQFQLGEREDCVRTIEKMLELFPGNELTGFALIRMGKIFEIQRRPEEALEIYKTVLSSFPQPNVAAQARLSIRTVDL